MSLDTVGRLPPSRTVSEIRADSWERADGPPAYATSCGLLKQPDKQECPKLALILKTQGNAAGNGSVLGHALMPSVYKRGISRFGIPTAQLQAHSISGPASILFQSERGDHKTLPFLRILSRRQIERVGELLGSRSSMS